MKAEKMKRLEENTTPTARKVLAVVPIQDAWTAQQITGEMQRNGVNMNFSVVMGCIRALMDNHLIREPMAGRFQRVTPKVHVPALAAVPKYTPPVEKQPKNEEPAVQNKTPLMERAANVARALRESADEIEKIALDYEQEIAAKTESTKELSQLADLIKKINKG